MRDVYRGYYPLSESEIDQLWATGLIVVDTNVLLNMYRTTPASRKAVTESLKGVQERLWLPHQVGLEFHKMREEVRQSARKAHREQAQGIETGAAKLRKLANEAAAINDAVDADSVLREALTEAAKALATEVRAGQKPFDEEADGEDELLQQVENLFRPHQVGKRFSHDELDGLRREAEDRYAREIPPGYADQGKMGDRRFGDFFIWKQMMVSAKRAKAGVIFVTNDEKTDWKHEGEARPELLQEFYEETDQLIHIYSPKGFTDEARSRGLWTPDSDDEANDVAAELQTYVDSPTPARPATSSIWASNILGLTQNALIKGGIIPGQFSGLTPGIHDWVPRTMIDVSQLGINQAFLRGMQSGYGLPQQNTPQAREEAVESDPDDDAAIEDENDD